MGDNMSKETFDETGEEGSSSHNSSIVNVSNSEDGEKMLENSPFLVEKVKETREIMLFGKKIKVTKMEDVRVYIAEPLQSVSPPTTPPPPPPPPLMIDHDQEDDSDDDGERFIIKRVKKSRMITLFGKKIQVSEKEKEKDEENVPEEPLQSTPASTDQIQGPHHEEDHSDKFPQVLNKIEQELGGIRPVFLFDKILTESDVNPNQNRLFILESQVLRDFMTNEERASIYELNEEVAISAIDGYERMYDKLQIKKWPSVNMTVIKGRDWRKMIAENRATIGFKVEVWGYRTQDARLRLAINFKANTDNQVVGKKRRSSSSRKRRQGGDEVDMNSSKRQRSSSSSSKQPQGNLCA